MIDLIQNLLNVEQKGMKIWIMYYYFSFLSKTFIFGHINIIARRIVRR